MGALIRKSLLLAEHAIDSAVRSSRIRCGHRCQQHDVHACVREIGHAGVHGNGAGLWADGVCSGLPNEGPPGVGV